MNSYQDFLVQINGTDPNEWFVIHAESQQDAALIHLNRQLNPLKLLPCTVYVSDGDRRWPSGAPCVVRGFTIAAKVTAEEEPKR